ncbi:hypothetical protein GUJ93_ZPchr0005g14649 [Zizania palustris]|uniref:Uncharacterized protein n=1 Tax=Zizania palustris TaxID=103762 RepID=A0A8J5T459_ZIZPA|nr:hypothetical protein GUJ93_ZPchr0005g14649 [Zizania palustris]
MASRSDGVEVVQLAGADHMAMISSPAMVADLLITIANTHGHGDDIRSKRVHEAAAYVQSQNRLCERRNRPKGKKPDDSRKGTHFLEKKKRNEESGGEGIMRATNFCS